MSPVASVAQLILLRGGEEAAVSPPPPTSDAELAEALVRGEKGAPHQAWLRFLPLVRGNLRRIVGPGVEDDDLAQEVFLRFFQRVNGLRDPAAVRGFIFAICLRVAHKELRRRWLKRWLRLTDDGSVPEAHPGGGGGGGGGEGADTEARDAVARYYRILDLLGVPSRSLFVARHVEGIDLMRVAEMHGLSVSTAQRRLARVTKRVEAMVRRDPVLAEIASRTTAPGEPARQIGAPVRAPAARSGPTSDGQRR